MAAVLVPGEGSVVARRAFLDTARYDAVVGDFYDGTPAAGLSSLVPGLGGGDGSVATGDEVTATVRGVSARSTGLMRPRVLVDYLDSSGNAGGSGWSSGSTGRGAGAPPAHRSRAATSAAGSPRSRSRAPRTTPRVPGC